MHTGHNSQNFCCLVSVVHKKPNRQIDDLLSGVIMSRALPRLQAAHHRAKPVIKQIRKL
jgi:hypothetical protein